MVKFTELKGLVIQAMKEKDTEKKDLLRLVTSQLENDRTKYGVTTANDLTEEHVEKGLRTFLKGLEKEKEVFVKLGKDTEKVEREIKTISELLPTLVTGDELKTLVHELLGTYETVNMGSLGKLKKDITVPVDFKEVSAIVKEFVNK